MRPSAEARGIGLQVALDPHAGAVLGDRDPTFADVPNLTYLRQVVDETLRLLAPQKDMNRVVLARDFEADLPRVAVDPDACRQVVLNLLLNAVDALGGEGRVRVALTSQSASAQREVLLQVTDSGPGIDASVRAHLFEPFVTTKSAGAGTGLGLAVVHGLVERAGGRVEADDAAPEDGGGARFRVWFPASS